MCILNKEINEIKKQYFSLIVHNQKYISPNKKKEILVHLYHQFMLYYIVNNDL